MPTLICKHADTSITRRRSALQHIAAHRIGASRASSPAMILPPTVAVEWAGPGLLARTRDTSPASQPFHLQPTRVQLITARTLGGGASWSCALYPGVSINPCQLITPPASNPSSFINNFTLRSCDPISFYAPAVRAGLRLACGSAQPGLVAGPGRLVKKRAQGLDEAIGCAISNALPPCW